MREVLKLLFPVHFRGNIYHKASMIICLPFLVVVAALSVWSNQNGVESVFSSLPDWALKIVSIVVVFIDPVAWLCFTLLIVSILVFKIVEGLETSGQLPEQLAKAMKPKLFFACFIFLLMTGSLTYATYLLSSVGGQKGAADYVEKEYKPAIGLDSLIKSNKQGVSNSISALKADYASRISTHKQDINAHKRSISSNKDWNRNGKANWNKYNAWNKAKADLKQTKADLSGIYALIEAKETAIKQEHKQLLSAQTATYTANKQKFDDASKTAATAMFYAVRSWTILGLLIQLISYILTADLYRAVAYAFVRQELQSHNRQSDIISKELLLISGNNEANKQRVSNEQVLLNQEHKPLNQSLNQPKQTEHLPEVVLQPKQEAVKQPIKQTVSDYTPEQEPPKAAPEHRPTSTPKPTPKQVVEQWTASGGFSIDWVQKWKFALLSEDLYGLSKKQAAERFTEMLADIPGDQKVCSAATVQNIRKAYQLMLSGFDGDKDKLRAVLREI